MQVRQKDESRDVFMSIFAEIDADGDQKISFTEFAQYVQNRAAKTDAELQIDAAASAFDNGDECIERDEVDALQPETMNILPTNLKGGAQGRRGQPQLYYVLRVDKHDWGWCRLWGDTNGGLPGLRWMSNTERVLVTGEFTLWPPTSTGCFPTTPSLTPRVSFMQSLSCSASTRGTVSRASDCLTAPYTRMDSLRFFLTPRRTGNKNGGRCSKSRARDRVPCWPSRTRRHLWAARRPIPCGLPAGWAARCRIKISSGMRRAHRRS